MEPQQVLLRRGLHIPKPRGHLRRVLRHRIAPRRTAVEPDPRRVGPVIIDRRPVGPGPTGVPGRRPIMVRPAHQVVQAQRGHVVHHRVARPHHHPHHRAHHGRVIGEGHPRPVLGDVPRRRLRVPGQPAEHVPVGLVELRAGPVSIRAHIGHPGHAGELRMEQLAIHHLGHRRTLALAPGVGPQGLLIERAQIGQVGGEAEILLGDLHLHHQRGLRHGPEQRVERLPRLEVDGPVLHLQDHIVPELAVQGDELGIGLLGPVVRLLLGVDEGPPHHDPAMRRQGVGQHVGPVRMAAAIVLRPRLALRIGLHQEAAEVGDRAIDLVRLGLPPGLHRRVGRVGGLQPPDLDGRREPRRQIDLHPIGPEHIGERRGPLQIGGRQAGGLGVDIVQHRPVDPDRGVGPGIVRIARVLPARQGLPVPQRLPRIAPLHRAIQIVPVVQHPDHGLGRRDDVQVVQRPARLDQPQQGEGAMQRPYFSVPGHHDGGVSAETDTADHIALGAHLRRQGHRYAGRRPHQDRPIAVHPVRQRGRNAQQPPQPTGQLRLRRHQAG